jgi:hypothetical protein
MRGREMKSYNFGQESTTASNTPSFPLDQSLMIVSECVVGREGRKREYAP